MSLAWAVSAHALLSCLATLLLLSCLSAPTSAQPISSIPFLSDQPRHFLPYSSANVQVPLTVRYLPDFTLVTSNATTLYAILTATPSIRYDVVTVSVRASDGARAVLLGQSYEHTSDFHKQCANIDTAHTGLCNVTLVMAGVPGTPSPVWYSVYTTTILPYNSAYSNTAPSGSLTYYSHYIYGNDLNVQFDLGSGSQLPLYTAILIATEYDPFTLVYPTAAANLSAISPYTDQTYLVTPTPTNNFSPGQYIVGLWCYNSSQPTSSLQLTPSYNPNTGSSTDDNSTGYATVLSVMALILSCAIAAILLLRVCIVVRRRRTQLVVMTRAEAAMFAPVVIGQTVLPPAAPVSLGATDAELATLPEMVYVRSMPVEGDEADFPRCTICLEDYLPNVSYITTLRCGHTFHSTCVHAWLRQRRYCPLCLQIIDRAHDVKKDRPLQQPSQPPSRQVELADLSHAGLSRLTSSSASSEVSAVSYSFSRPTRGSDATDSGPAFPNWDEDVPSRSVALSDGRSSSQASVYYEHPTT